MSQCVILLHGLGRTRYSMQPLAIALGAVGYHIINQGYASRRETIESQALKTIPAAIAECMRYRPDSIHFVTHSMGGILLRYYLSRCRINFLGRVVMLSPPNHGSEVVDHLNKYRCYRCLMGPAAAQLGTGRHSIPIILGAANMSVGIITGNHHSFFDGVFSTMIAGANDGKVSIESAKLEGMSDFLVVPETHSFIMNSDYVINQVIYFLKKGQFQTHAENDTTVD